MKYVLSKEDLIRFKNMSVYMLTSDDTCKTSTEKAVDKFLKSKTPVEEIAEGMIEKNNWSQFIFVNSNEEILGYMNVYPNILTEEQKELLNNSTGKNIKIYIEEITSKNSRVSFKDIKLSIENSPNRKEVIK